MTASGSGLINERQQTEKEAPGRGFFVYNEEICG